MSSGSSVSKTLESLVVALRFFFSGTEVERNRKVVVVVVRNGGAPKSELVGRNVVKFR